MSKIVGHLLCTFPLCSSPFISEKELVYANKNSSTKIVSLLIEFQIYFESTFNIVLSYKTWAVQLKDRLLLGIETVQALYDSTVKVFKKISNYRRVASTNMRY